MAQPPIDFCVAKWLSIGMQNPMDWGSVPLGILDPFFHKSNTFCHFMTKFKINHLSYSITYFNFLKDL